MTRAALVRRYERFVALSTVGLLVATLARVRTGAWPSGALIVLALACGGAPSVIDAFARRPRPDARPAPQPPGADAAFTTVIRLGREPREVARTSIILAARLGPTVVVTTRARGWLDEMATGAISVVVAPTIEGALHEAARTIATDAILVVSASAFPLDSGARQAAEQLHDGVAWVTGRAPSPNDDRYAPRERELLAERLRSTARAAGATLWEPDATVVRTELVAAHPIESGRPWGAWLRALEADGHRGLDLAEPIAHRAAPADAPGFWPSQIMRTRAAAADLSGATKSGPPRARLLAAAAVLHELFAWSLALWALVPLLIGWTGDFPLSAAPLGFVAAVAANAVARWSATRLAHGVELHPIHDTRAAAYDAPGSLLALASAVSGRVHRRRIYIPDQPLLWCALVLTFATTVLLLGRTSTSGTGATVAAGAATVNLVVLWAFAIRAVGKRAWDRTAYRLALDVPVSVAGRAAHLIEGSPTGAAVSGDFDGVEIGATLALTVHFGGRSEPARAVEVRARVANRRAGSEPTVLGLALALDPETRVAWVSGLFEAAAVAPIASAANAVAAHRPPHPAPRGYARSGRVRTGAFAFRFEMLLVGVVSVFSAAVLAFVLLGYRPLVETSGSMRPALQVGDLVVTTSVSAGHLHVGDIVSFPDPAGTGELLTHRVKTIVTSGDSVRVETRGDANALSERWSVPGPTELRRTVWDIPIVGGVVSHLGSPSVREGLVGAGAVAAAVVLSAARKRKRGTRPAFDLLS